MTSKDLVQDGIHQILQNYNDFQIVDPTTITVAELLAGQRPLLPEIQFGKSKIVNFKPLCGLLNQTIVKKVPVSADYNHMIFDQCVLINDYNDCGGNTVKTLYFQLRSSRGDLIPLNGCNWSFSIVFSRNLPDL